MRRANSSFYLFVFLKKALTNKMLYNIIIIQKRKYTLFINDLNVRNKFDGYCSFFNMVLNTKEKKFSSSIPVRVGLIGILTIDLAPFL